MHEQKLLLIEDGGVINDRDDRFQTGRHLFVPLRNGQHHADQLTVAPAEWYDHTAALQMRPEHMRLEPV